MKPKLIVLAMLLVLAGASFGLSYVELGGASLAVALLIAALKAALVGTVFMEVGREKASFKLALLAAALLVAMLLGFVAADVKTRGTPPLPAPVTTQAVI